MTSRAEGAAADARDSQSASVTGAGAVYLGRVLGVRLFLDWSLLVIFALLLFNLGGGLLPAWHPDWGAALTWGTALVATVLFFASIVAHELSHALVANRNGIPVTRITLFLFGGLAHMESEPPSPRSEFLMAAVGPLTSLAIGVVATGLGLLLAGSGFPAALVEDPEAAVATLGPGATLLLWLGPINVMLGLFNVIPGFPLDGGRVLRSIVWWLTDDLRRATLWASRAGRLFAVALMAWGLVNVLGGALLQGMWLLLIGWFLNNAARASYEQVVLRETLQGVKLSALMRTRFASVGPDTSVERLVREELMAAEQRAFPVVGPRGELRGLVCLEDVRKVPQARWAETSVSEIMTPREELVTLPPDAAAEEALAALGRRGVDQVPVLEDDRPVGLVRSQDVVRWMSLHPQRL